MAEEAEVNEEAAAGKKPGKSVAKAGANSTTDLSTVDYGEYSTPDGQAAGFEGSTQDDFSIPFLDILQGQSPEVESLPDAKPGMFHNTVTDDLYDGKTGVSVVVAGRHHEFVEWVPRNKGGGIVGRHSVDSDVVAKARERADKFNELTTENGNELVETYYAYLILNLSDGPLPAVLSCTSTRIRPYKAMMTKAKMIMVPDGKGGKRQPPLFAHKFRLTTDKRKNNDGEWHTFNVAFDSDDKSAVKARLAPTDPLFQAAVDFNSVIKAGAFTTNEAGEAKARDNAAQGDDVPF
jgi:hypothetical protein